MSTEKKLPDKECLDKLQALRTFFSQFTEILDGKRTEITMESLEAATKSSKTADTLN